MSRSSDSGFEIQFSRRNKDVFQKTNYDRNLNDIDTFS